MKIILAALLIGFSVQAQANEFKLPPSDQILAAQEAEAHAPQAFVASSTHSEPSQAPVVFIGLYELIAMIYWLINIRPELDRVRARYSAQGLEAPQPVLLWGTPILKTFMVVNIIGGAIVGFMVGWNAPGPQDEVARWIAAMGYGVLFGVFGIGATLIPYFVIIIGTLLLVCMTFGLAWIALKGIVSRVFHLHHS